MSKEFELREMMGLVVKSRRAFLRKYQLPEPIYDLDAICEEITPIWKGYCAGTHSAQEFIEHVMATIKAVEIHRRLTGESQ